MNEFSDLIQHLFEGVYIVDQSRKIVFWNSGSEKITGYTAEEVVGEHCYHNILKHVTPDGKELCFDGCPLHHTLATGEIQQNDVYLHHKDGYRVPVSVKTFPLRDADGNITASVEVFTDSRYQKSNHQENRKLRELLTIDTLTNVPNRRYLEFQLETLVREYKQFKTNFGILFFDIDHFKNVNDTYGHNVGDEILRIVAGTLRNTVRGKDTIGRWGGEEFIGLIKVDSLEGLMILSEKLRVLVEKSSYSMSETEELKVTISVGGTLYRAGESYIDLIQRADELMYYSKQNGRNRSTIK